MTPLTTAEVADLLGITRARAWRLIRDGHIKSFTLPGGGGVRMRAYVNPSDLLDFVVNNNMPQPVADRVKKLAQG